MYARMYSGNELILIFTPSGNQLAVGCNS